MVSLPFLLAISCAQHDAPDAQGKIPSSIYMPEPTLTSIRSCQEPSQIGMRCLNQLVRNLLLTHSVELCGVHRTAVDPVHGHDTPAVTGECPWPDTNRSTNRRTFDKARQMMSLIK